MGGGVEHDVGRGRHAGGHVRVGRRRGGGRRGRRVVDMRRRGAGVGSGRRRERGAGRDGGDKGDRRTGAQEPGRDPRDGQRGPRTDRGQHEARRDERVALIGQRERALVLREPGVEVVEPRVVGQTDDLGDSAHSGQPQADRYGIPALAGGGVGSTLGARDHSFHGDHLGPVHRLD